MTWPGAFCIVIVDLNFDAENLYALWATRDELRIAIVGWIEWAYNRRRRQAALCKLTPIALEKIMDTPDSQAA